MTLAPVQSWFEVVAGFKRLNVGWCEQEERRFACLRVYVMPKIHRLHPPGKRQNQSLVPELYMRVSSHQRGVSPTWISRATTCPFHSRVASGIGHCANNRRNRRTALSSCKRAPLVERNCLESAKCVVSFIQNSDARECCGREQGLQGACRLRGQ